MIRQPTSYTYQTTNIHIDRQADVFIDAHGHAQIDIEINMLTL